MIIRVEIKLARLLKAIGEEESYIENARQALAEKPEFEPYTVFKSLDTKANNYLSVPQLHEFLKENKANVFAKDLENFFKVCNANGDGRLTYYDFINFVLPRANTNLRETCAKREPYYSRNGFKLPFEIGYGTAKLFEKAVNSLKKLETLRKDLLENEGINLLEAYALITKEKSDCFNYDAVEAFFSKNTIPISEENIFSFFRHADKNKDGKLSYVEFVQAITPVGFTIDLDTVPVYERNTFAPTRGSVPNNIRNTASHFSTPGKRLTFAEENRSKFFSASIETLQKYENISKSIRKFSSVSRSPKLNKSLNSRSPKTKHSPEDQYSRGRSFSPPKIISQGSQIKNRALSVEDLDVSPGKFYFRASVTSEKASYIKDFTVSSFTNNRSFIPSGVIVKNGTNSLRSSVKEYQTNQSGFKYDSPTRRREEEDIVSILRKQIDSDRELEEQKSQFNRRADFNLHDAFRMFDVDQTGYVTKSQLQSGLEHLDIFPTREELYLLISILDKDADGLIRFEDFRDILAPRFEKSFSSSLTSYKNISIKANKTLTELFSKEALNSFRNIIRSIITNKVSSEEMRRTLSIKQKTSGIDTFKILDRNQDGFVSLDEFQDLFQDYGMTVTKKELSMLLNKHDKNESSKISYSDYIQEITPKCPSKV